MESSLHVENVPSHKLTCGECGNISLEHLLRRYSIRSSSRSGRKSHPYLRPIENVCTESKYVNHDKWSKTLSTGPSSFHSQTSSASSLQAQHHYVPPNPRFKAGFKRTTDEPNCANNSSRISEWKNLSLHSHVGDFQSDKNLIDSNCTPELKSMIDSSNKTDELCNNSTCDVCLDYDKLQFYLESLIASGTGSGEALNLLQQHCCSHENDELEFECELCGCSFDCSVELISHLSLHPENWPYVCQLCRKRFKTSLNKQRHLCGLQC